MLRREERENNGSGGYRRLQTRNNSSFLNNRDRNESLNSYSEDEQTVIATQYTYLDNFLAEFSNILKEEKYQLNNTKRFETNEYSKDRNIIKLMSSGGIEYFHFSLFIKKDDKTGIRRYGGLHITCPGTTKRLYLEHDNILEKSSEGANFCYELLKQLFKTLKTYFETEKHSNGDNLNADIQIVIDCILDKFPHRDVAKREICESLNILIRESNFKPLFDSFRSRERDLDERGRYANGGSTKSVMYLVKIDKLKQKNKLLKKDKIKNKNKIEKNNKLIQELKAKAKKEKAKAKAKAKKEKAKTKVKAKKEKAKAKKEKAKAKAKAKKVTCKKSTCSKKNKK